MLTVHFWDWYRTFSWGGRWHDEEGPEVVAMCHEDIEAYVSWEGVLVYLQVCSEGLLISPPEAPQVCLCFPGAWVGRCR